MFPQNNTKNAYLVARLKTLQSEFLDQNHWERMIEAKDGEEALQVLNETVYARYFGEMKGPQDFDVVLNDSLGEAKNLILKIFAPKSVLYFLWLKYDFLNVKSLIKAKFAGEEPKFNTLGEIKFADLRAVILKEEKRKLPYNLNKTIEEVKENYEKKKDPREIDFILDKRYLEIFSRELQKIRSRELSNFLRREIDLFNIKVYFRFPGQDFVEEALIPGGLVPREKFKIKEPEKLIAGIRDFHERVLMHHLREGAEKEGVLSLEREGRRILLTILSEMEDNIWGIEPVFAFWQAKVEETKLIHKILTLKNAGIEPAEIHRLVG